MDDPMVSRIRSAVLEWAERTFNTKNIVVGMAAKDDAEDDEGDRYLVDYAVRDVGYWLVAEVWIADGEILSINDLGEGLPLGDARWPWPQDEVA
jgi:hypothetical protein